MNVVRSNPVDKLSVENGLTAKGIAEADAAAVTLQDFGLECPQMWYSTWAKASQTASILGERLQMGFERRLPECDLFDWLTRSHCFIAFSFQLIRSSRLP